MFRKSNAKLEIFFEVTKFLAINFITIFRQIPYTSKYQTFAFLLLRQQLEAAYIDFSDSVLDGRTVFPCTGTKSAFKQQPGAPGL